MEGWGGEDGWEVLFFDEDAWWGRGFNGWMGRRRGGELRVWW